jgi:hypothetical protein
MENAMEQAQSSVDLLFADLIHSSRRGDDITVFNRFWFPTGMFQIDGRFYPENLIFLLFLSLQRNNN